MPKLLTFFALFLFSICSFGNSFTPEDTLVNVSYSVRKINDMKYQIAITFDIKDGYYVSAQETPQVNIYSDPTLITIKNSNGFNVSNFAFSEEGKMITFSASSEHRKLAKTEYKSKLTAYKAKVDTMSVSDERKFELVDRKTNSLLKEKTDKGSFQEYRYYTKVTFVSPVIKIEKDGTSDKTRIVNVVVQYTIKKDGQLFPEDGDKDYKEFTIKIGE